MKVRTVEAEMTLLDFLAARQNLSRRKVKALLDRRTVLVNRRPVWMARHRLRAGDAVTCPAAPPVPPPGDAIAVLLKTPDFAVVDKPPGLLACGPDSVESRLRSFPGWETVRAVHRLDRETSGCLLLARTAAGFDAAVAVFRRAAVHKQYHALVAGRFGRGAATVRKSVDGKRAVTHIRLLQAGRHASHLAVSIETGRTHQIRRHLASLHHPVLGDRQYGLGVDPGPEAEQVSRQMLHASALRLPDPGGGVEIHARSPLPSDFRSALRLYGLR